MTQLTPSERQDLESVALNEGRSLSATVRQYYLRGLESYRREQSTAS